MALADVLNMPDITPEQNKWLKGQQLLGAAAALLNAGAPSTDPRSRSLAFALSQGLQGMAGGRQLGLENLGQGANLQFAQQKMQALQQKMAQQKKVQEEMAKIPTTEAVQMPNVPVSEVGYPYNPVQQVPRGMADLMRDAIKANIQAGDVEGASHYATVLKAMEGEAPGGLREFEMVTGIPASQRGTPTYEQIYMNFEKQKKEAGQRATEKTPLAMTDKGWTISANPQGVNVARRYGENGQLIEEAYNEKKHGKAIQTTIPQTVIQMTTNAQDDAKTIGDAIMRGEQSPIISGFGMAKIAAPLKAYLAKQGYNLRQAELDFHATQKHLNTLNGAQQLRLRQAVTFAYDSLGIVEDLAKKWNGGKFPILNRANLKLAINGALGPEAQSIATQLDTQISDLTSELGTVYKGGNSSTDESLKLAAKNLSAEWSYKQLMDNVALVRKNLAIRQNSISSTGAAGLSPEAPPVPTPEATKPSSNAIQGAHGTY